MEHDHLHDHSGHSHAHSLEDLSVGLSILGKFFDLILFLNFIVHFCEIYVFILHLHEKYWGGFASHGCKIGNIGKEVCSNSNGSKCLFIII